MYSLGEVAVRTILWDLNISRQNRVGKSYALLEIPTEINING